MDACFVSASLHNFEADSTGTCAVAYPPGVPAFSDLNENFVNRTPLLSTSETLFAFMDMLMV